MVSVALCYQVKSSITYTEPDKLVWKLSSCGKRWKADLKIRCNRSRFVGFHKQNEFNI